MIELFNIVFLVASFLGLSFFSFFLFNKNNTRNNINIIESSGFNFIIFLNFLLLISLIDPNMNLLFWISIFLSLVSIFLIFKNKNKIDSKLIYFFLIFFTIVISIDISNNFDYSWDTKKYYLHKATAFYQGYFIDDFVKKAEYPHFANYIWGFFWKNSFVNAEYTGRLVFGYIYILSIFYFINSLKIEKLLKLVFSILLIFLTYKTILFDGRPDILLTAFFFFVAKEIYEIFHKKNFKFKNIILLSLSLNLILWTKTEGMAYILIVTTMIILFVKQNFNKKLIFFSSILLFIFIKYFTYYYYGITFNPHEDTFGESFLSKIDLNFLILRSWQITSWYFAYFLANPITLTSLISLVIIFKYSPISFISSCFFTFSTN